MSTRTEGTAPPIATKRRLRRGRQAITMDDVARSAGVSPSTVSLFLRKPDEVTESTGTAIARAVAELGYVENFAAGGLAAARTPVVSLIVPSIRNAFFAETASAIQAGLSGARQQMILGDTEYALDREEALVRTALAWRPSAIVLTGVDHSAGTRILLAANNTTVIEMWDIGPNPLQHSIGFQHPNVGAMATQHLLAHGCRSIVFAGGRMRQDRRAAQRSAGYRQFMRDMQLEDLVLDAPVTADVALGEPHLDAALTTMPALDGIVCSNDSLALGILFAAQRRGISVPGDLRVIGFGDLPFAAHCIPAMTTIRPPSTQIGRAVARLILETERDPSTNRTTIQIDPVLVQRDSA